jgi:DNA-binding response OmpR family regulator
MFTTMPVEPPTVLLIDDEPPLLVLLRAALRRAGFDVYVANNGSEGEREALAHLPDIIVSDVMMSPPDGFELRQRLADNSATRNIPFIFLTARTDPADRRRALEDGADDYITKPFDREELITRIRAALRRQPWQRQAEHPLGGSLNVR